MRGRILLLLFALSACFWLGETSCDLNSAAVKCASVANDCCKYESCMDSQGCNYPCTSRDCSTSTSGGGGTTTPSTFEKQQYMGALNPKIASWLNSYTYMHFMVKDGIVVRANCKLGGDCVVVEEDPFVVDSNGNNVGRFSEVAGSSSLPSAGGSSSGSGGGGSRPPIEPKDVQERGVVEPDVLHFYPISLESNNTHLKRDGTPDSFWIKYANYMDSWTRTCQYEDTFAFTYKGYVYKKHSSKNALMKVANPFKKTEQLRGFLGRYCQLVFPDSQSVSWVYDLHDFWGYKLGVLSTEDRITDQYKQFTYVMAGLGKLNDVQFVPHMAHNSNVAPYFTYKTLAASKTGMRNLGSFVCMSLYGVRTAEDRTACYGDDKEWVVFDNDAYEKGETPFVSITSEKRPQSSIGPYLITASGELTASYFFNLKEGVAYSGSVKMNEGYFACTSCTIRDKVSPATATLPSLFLTLLALSLTAVALFY